MLKFIILLVFAMLSNTSSAFSVDYIVNYTKHKVTRSEATKIVSSVNKFSLMYDVDPEMVFKIMKTESSFNRKAKNKASIGLMQIIPKWHKEKIGKRNLYDIETNVEVGIRIIAEYSKMVNGNVSAMLQRYNGSKNKKKYAKKVLAIKEETFIVSKRNNVSPTNESHDEPKTTKPIEVATNTE